MRVRFEVTLPDDLFEKFFRWIRAFDLTHKNVHVAMVCDQSGIDTSEMEAIFRRVMPESDVVVLPHGGH